MADLRTTITEVVTALGTLGFDDVEDALACRPPQLRNVDDDVWEALRAAWDAPGRRALFHAAWSNGRAFLAANDALRGRRPEVVEWKGAHRAPGDEVVPADIRIDHVYFVSCKYLSRIVMNASPAHLFDRLLAGGHGKRGGDWFAEVAPAQLGALYGAVRDAVELDLPHDVGALTATDRRSLALALRSGWPDGAAPHYEALVEQVASESAQRWRGAIARDAQRLLWRLLRIGSAPYYVLGLSADDTLRLRIATPWDWRQQFELCDFRVTAGAGGQPVVRWEAIVRARDRRDEMPVEGHVEVRWSHGRFCGPPEAKVYLDTAHRAVPGYFALA
ncbi:MAG: hypothetical protein QOI55_1797 [Actinomycetota bacterium]|nr:hypothetical protein [Actinomycetota bacterium]